MQRKTISLLFLGGTAALVLCGALLLTFAPQGWRSDPAYEEAQRDLSQLRNLEYQRYFEKKIDVLFKHDGINGMIDQVTQALVEGQIDMFDCHSLAHVIGHYGGYGENYGQVHDFLSKENLDFCGSGFMHGVEGQLANEPYPQNVEKLYEFCKLAMPLDPYYQGCYHGAGHSFMENTRDPLEALKQCDLLTYDDTITHASCYRGVFSEHADQQHKAGSSAGDLLSFCSSLAEELQGYCAKELNGLGLSTTAQESEIEEALALCIAPAIASTVQKGCVESVATAAADFMLGKGEDVTPLPIVRSFSDELTRTYIRSFHDSFFKTQMHDHSVSFDPFCSWFDNEEHKAYCFEIAAL